MASYTSELQYLANPVTAHVQSAEQHNQDVNSLGLISARKSAEAIEILKLMTATYLAALCQAFDLRHLEEVLHQAIKSIVTQVAKKALCTGANGEPLPSRFVEKDLLQVVDTELAFAYIDDPCRSDYPLMQKLKDVLVDHSIQYLALDDTTNSDELEFTIFSRINPFEVKLKEQLEPLVKMAQTQFNSGSSQVPNRIQECRSYPGYKFEREGLGTELLSGTRTVSPGEQIESIHAAICNGRIMEPLINCLDGWPQRPGPF